ncbi:acetylxylan esterase [soil metagenome]
MGPTKRQWDQRASSGRSFSRQLTSLAVGILFVFGGAGCLPVQAAERLPWSHLPPPFDDYLQQRVGALSGRGWLDGITAENWPDEQAAMRQELRGMLGLDPWPERTALRPVTTGRVQGDGYTVEKFYFEPLPGLYIAANLYVPAEAEQGPLPAVLYMSGHAVMMDGETRLGNKTGYQHHASWFARHGYVCLILDTIDLGEIPGAHRGTGRLDRWWWPARGYTPAGVEAWVGIRALDYLETRPEVDASRIGMTGRSGGGIYTWWVGALDDRIKVAVPVAGITTLRDHVMTGAIEGHCDCMYMVNTLRWDFDRVAALMAPRPLLISNTDKDTIYPLAGVMEIYNRTRELYGKLGEEANVGLHIAEGPHKDTQPLHIGAFNWLNRFLKAGDRSDLIDEPARPLHEPSELKVFDTIPPDETVTTVDEFFVPPFSAPDDTPTAGGWAEQRAHWMVALRENVFRAWPDPAPPAVATKGERVTDGLRLTHLEVTTQHHLTLPLWILHGEGVQTAELGTVALQVLDDPSWEVVGAWLMEEGSDGADGADLADLADLAGFLPGREALLDGSVGLAFFCPRGVGPTSIAGLPKGKRDHLLRRLLLLGESLESGQVWDIRQAVAALRSVSGLAETPLTLRSGNVMAANSLYASLYLEGIAGLELADLPASHRTGPTYLNVLRFLDLPQALAMAAERAPVTVYAENPVTWRYAQRVAEALGHPESRVQIRPLAEAPRVAAP